jgi:hypothetical protein
MMGQVKRSRLRNLRNAVKRKYWYIVKRFNRLAYLNHVVSSAPDMYEELEEIQAIETRQWVKRGYRVHLDVNDIPVCEDQGPHWIDGSAGRFVAWDTLRKFKKMVEDAEYERNRRKREGREIWIKWFTAGFAAVGALGGLATLINLYLTYRKKP